MTFEKGLVGIVATNDGNLSKRQLVEKTETFRKLHVRRKPILLYNMWDAGSAQAVAGSGARAIAAMSTDNGAAPYIEALNNPGIGCLFCRGIAVTPPHLS